MSSVSIDPCTHEHLRVSGIDQTRRLMYIVEYDGKKNSFGNEYSSCGKYLAGRKPFSARNQGPIYL